MKISKPRAIEIKRIFLDEIEKTRTIPGHIVQPFYDYFNGEFSPGRFAQMPCSCSPKIWIEMVKEVTDAVNEALNSQDVEFITSLEENLVNQEQVKKKSKKIKEIADVADKTTENE
jgi:hypothetical protein